MPSEINERDKNKNRIGKSHTVQSHTKKKSNAKTSLLFVVLAILLLGLIVFFYQSFIGDKEQPCTGDDCTASQLPPVSTSTQQLGIASDLKAIPREDLTAEDSNMLAAVDIQEVTLNIQGSNTIGSELMPKLVEAYYRNKGSKLTSKLQEGLEENKYIFANNHQMFAVGLGSHGSSTGFKALADKDATIAMSSRKIKPKEVRLLERAGFGDMTQASQEFVVGIDGIAIIVHPANPINEISVSDLRLVFAGKITNWAQLGGADQAIHLYVRDDNSGTKDTFDALVMQKTRLGPAKAFEDSNLLSESVSNDVGGIGYIGLPYINNAKALAVSDGTTTALRPTPFTLSTEDYPLTRRLYLYVPNSASVDARALANFAVSAEGQEIVERTGFIGQKAKSRKIDASELEIAQHNEGYKALVDKGERINTNFRFGFSNSTLDNKAKQDLGRITQLLNSKSQSNQNYRLVLVGFTDNTGAECMNNALSLQRARIVAKELASYGIKADVIEGMGSEAPVADNTTILGREKNRRVELWLAPLQDLPKFPIRPVCG